MLETVAEADYVSPILYIIFSRKGSLWREIVNKLEETQILEKQVGVLTSSVASRRSEWRRRRRPRRGPWPLRG